MWVSGTYHTDPRTVPRVCRWLLKEGLTTNHRVSMIRLQEPSLQGQFQQPILPQRTTRVFVLAYHEAKYPCHAGPSLGAPRSQGSYSAQGRPLHGAAPHSPATRHLPSQGAAGAFGPVGRAQAAHWTLSGCWDNRPQEFRPPSLPLGEKGTELARPAAWPLFQPPGERES